MWPARPASGEARLVCQVSDRGPHDVTLRLAGTLTRDPWSRRFEREIEDHYVDDGVRRIRIDVQDLEAIDLEGIGVLVHLFRESERRGKVLTVEGSDGPVRRRLLTTGVLRIMEPRDAA